MSNSRFNEKKKRTNNNNPTDMQNKTKQKMAILKDKNALRYDDSKFLANEGEFLLFLRYLRLSM